MSSKSAGIVDGGVALMIEEADSEGGVDGGLIGIGGGTSDLVKAKASEQVGFIGETMIDTEGKLIGVGGNFGRRGIGARAVGAGGIIGERIASEDGGDGGVDGNGEGIAGKSGGVDTETFGGSGNSKNLSGAEDLTEALVFAEEKSAIRAVVDVRKDDRTADGKAKFIASKGRNAARGLRRGVVKKITSVERGVADEFKDAAVNLSGAGFGDDVAETGSAMADFRGHDAGAGLNFLNGINVEIGKGGATQFRVGGVGAIHGEDGGDAALTIDGKLLGEIGGAIGVGHGACSEEKEFAEVAGVEGQAGNFAAGKIFAAAGLSGGFLRRGIELDFGALGRDAKNGGRGGSHLEDDGGGQGPNFLIFEEGEEVLTGGDIREGKDAGGGGRSDVFRGGGGGVKFESGVGNGIASIVAEDTTPR